MNFQFKTSTALLGTAFVGICTAGMGAALMVISPNGPSYLAEWKEWQGILGSVAIAAPVFVPAVFLAYMAGRRAVTTRTIVAFAIAEGASVGYLKWIVATS